MARVLWQGGELWQQAAALGRAGCLHLQAAAQRRHLAQLSPGSRERRIAYFQFRALEDQARALWALAVGYGISAASHQGLLLVA
jgi:hypothetical protein